MGIDVRLYVKGPVTEEFLADANEYFEERGLGGTLYTPLVVEHDRVFWVGGARYFSPAYSRGHWPTIYHAIRCMIAAFPGRVVYYGSDVTEDAPVVSASFLDECWEAWLL